MGLDETESWRRHQEDERKTQEADLLKAKQARKSSLVKNAGRDMANERELQANRKASAEREEEAVKLVGAVDTAKKSMGRHEGPISKARLLHVAEEEDSKEKQDRGHRQADHADARLRSRKRWRRRSAWGAQALCPASRCAAGMALAPVKNGISPGLQHEHTAAAC